MNPCVQNTTWPLHHLNYGTASMTTASLKPDDLIQQSVAVSSFTQTSLGQYSTKQPTVDPNTNPWNPSLVYPSNI